MINQQCPWASAHINLAKNTLAQLANAVLMQHMQFFAVLHNDLQCVHPYESAAIGWRCEAISQHAAQGCCGRGGVNSHCLVQPGSLRMNQASNVVIHTPNDTRFSEEQVLFSVIDLRL